MKEELINLNGMEFEILELLLSFVPIFFLFFFIIALKIRFYSILVSIIAYPTYITLFLIEDMFLKKKDLKNKKFFRVNIPKDAMKKISMNSCATLVSFVMFFIIYKYILGFKWIGNNLRQGIYDNNAIWNDIIQVFIISPGILVFLLIFISIIYSISYFEEVEEKTGMGKIIDLSIPSLWKSIIKKDD